MQLWFPLLAANAAAILLLMQALLTREPERLRWIQRRAVLVAWAAFLGALLVGGFAASSVYSAYQHGVPAALRAKGIDPVSFGMRAILVAMLMLLLPLVVRSLVNARVNRAQK